MTNYDDIYLKKENHVIGLRIVFGENYDTRTIESEYNGKIFTNSHDIPDFDNRYHELKNAGYEEVQMCTSYSYKNGEKIRKYNFK